MNIPHNIDEILNNHYHNKYFSLASEYGEPGYSNINVEAVMLGNYWCNCKKIDDGRSHSIEAHHPRLFQKMEEEGYEFEWSDEWKVVNDKAWRIKSDSHGWLPSIRHVDGEYITADDGLEVWIEACKNSDHLTITCPAFSDKDFINLGWEQFNGVYENGFHPGQIDTPQKALEEIHKEHGQYIDWVFSVPRSGQFDIQFKAWIKEW